MKTKLIILFIAAATSLLAQVKVQTGIEVLHENNIDILKGKRVGLITNPTGIDRNLKSTIDILFEAENVKLTALFGPEHGVRGNIEGGTSIDTYIDEQTQLPVYSLYGKTRKPTPEMLKDIDVLVYDIQDIGCRSYTFISTMGLMMETAAENNIEVVILDRPNPLGGNRVEGAITENDFISFISQFPIPYVYGLTCGELAKFLNEEKILKNQVQCKLTVVPMKNWKREMSFEDTGLPWVLTSPHIPHNYSAYYYVVSGIVGELRDAVSIGVGYTLPFQTFATAWIDAEKLARKMNSYNLEGVIFRPINYIPYYGTGKDENLKGVQIHITDYQKVHLMEIQFYFMQAIHELYPEKNLFELATKGQIHAFDLACGTDKIRTEFIKNYKVSDILDLLNKGLDEFKQTAAKNYLY